MQKLFSLIIVPDPASDEIQPGQQSAFEMEGHCEDFIAVTVGPWVMLASNANAGLIGNVAGEREIC